MTSRDGDVKHAVNAVIEEYRQGFLHLDPHRLASIWDRTHDPLIYVAMEKSELLEGWPAIQRYFEALPTHLEQVSAMVVDRVRVIPLSDAALAIFHFRASVRLKGRSGLHQPAGRVTMALRPTSSGWRTIHYHESALAAVAAGQ